MKFKKIESGYSIITVIFILTFILTILTLATLFISFYLHLSSINLKKSSGWEPFYKTLKDLKEKYFEINLRDEYTSPSDGWFKDIPDNLNGYKISVVPEDSKLDINQIDTALFFTSQNKNNDVLKIDFSKVKGNYFYYMSELDDAKPADNSPDNKTEKIQQLI